MLSDFKKRVRTQPTSGCSVLSYPNYHRIADWVSSLPVCRTVTDEMTSCNYLLDLTGLIPLLPSPHARAIHFRAPLCEQVHRKFPLHVDYCYASQWVHARRSLSALLLSNPLVVQELNRLPHNRASSLLEYDPVVNAVGVSMAAIQQPLFYTHGTLAMRYAAKVTFCSIVLCSS